MDDAALGQGRAPRVSERAVADCTAEGMIARRGGEPLADWLKNTTRLVGEHAFGTGLAAVAKATGFGLHGKENAYHLADVAPPSQRRPSSTRRFWSALSNVDESGTLWS
ncbi:hypothetical protein GCM10022222_30560 [Amycolatopsis ultiminotia]|uniref:Uncharacterized protein n=1 Tax=Amycolatopsis ultiminotia TaxID=543629 RepID=A0ABP6W5B0_9PSEU